MKIEMIDRIDLMREREKHILIKKKQWNKSGAIKETLCLVWYL